MPWATLIDPMVTSEHPEGTYGMSFRILHWNEEERVKHLSITFCLPLVMISLMLLVARGCGGLVSAGFPCYKERVRETRCCIALKRSWLISA